MQEKGVACVVCVACVACVACHVCVVCGVWCVCWVKNVRRCEKPLCVVSSVVFGSRW